MPWSATVTVEAIAFDSVGSANGQSFDFELMTQQSQVPLRLLSPMFRVTSKISILRNLRCDRMLKKKVKK